MSRIRGGLKVLRGMKQESDGKVLMDACLRSSGRRLIAEGRTEMHKRSPGPTPPEQIIKHPSVTSM
ncbi:hypothetical protein [Streptomyces zhihengii]|uniref:hypothetical protein n=1 Tax=Streptomyces zhihengii TaxID=1818004 RepID=UPI0033B31B59